MADVLSGGPEPGPSAHRRRWGGVAAAVAVAAVAAVLASRATSDRTDAAPPPTPTVAVAPGPEADPRAPEVVSVAVGTRWAYALVAECTSAAILACAYRLHRRDLSGTGWAQLSLRTEARGVANVLAEVDVTGDDVVTVLFGPAGGRALTSTDDGETFTEHPLRLGPSIGAVPPAGLLNSGAFNTGNRLTVLDPATGSLRPLAVQPPLNGAPLGSYQQRGDVIWAVGSTPDGAVSAVSRDRGRSWRTRPVRGLNPGVEVLQIVAAADGRGYLLPGTVVDERIRLAGVWEYGEDWRRVAAPVPRTLSSAQAGVRGLLVVDNDGDLWRLGPAGFARLPESVPEQVGALIPGPDRRLATVPVGPPGEVVLLSEDDGDTWQAEAVS